MVLNYGKKTSTTQKVLRAMRVMIVMGKNTDGLMYKQVWSRLESIPALKKELYNEENKNVRE